MSKTVSQSVSQSRHCCFLTRPCEGSSSKECMRVWLVIKCDNAVWTKVKEGLLQV